MKKSKVQKSSKLRAPVLRATKVHFFYVLAVAVFVIQYDAWRLITSHALLQRWMMVSFMMTVVTVCWYAARQRENNDIYYKFIAGVLIGLDIFVAGFSVYTQRGMASRAVALFAIPIIMAAIVSRAAIFATAALSVTAYSLASVGYFALNPSEGYKVELYADLTFYSAVFFILSALLWVFISKHSQSHSE